MCIGEPRPSSYSILPVDFVRLTMESRRKRVCPRLNCVSDNDWKGRFSTQSKRECCSVNRPEINALILFWCLRTLTFLQHSHSNERNNSLILISVRSEFNNEQKGFATILIFRAIFRDTCYVSHKITTGWRKYHAGRLIIWLCRRVLLIKLLFFRMTLRFHIWIKSLLSHMRTIWECSQK